MEAPGKNQAPIQCKSGCGFYGNPATEGLCSKCYKDYCEKNQIPLTSASSSSPVAHRSPEPAPASSSVDTASPTVPVIVQSDIDVAAQPKVEEATKKKNRCTTCKKKVGLTGFGCRCGGLFCSVHRYSDKHSCSFDYKSLGADEIRKNNPVVKGEKIQQI